MTEREREREREREPNSEILAGVRNVGYLLIFDISDNQSYSNFLEHIMGTFLEACSKPLTIIAKHSILDVAAALAPPLVTPNQILIKPVIWADEVP